MLRRSLLVFRLIDAYQELCVRLNGIVHSPDGGVDVEGLWSECLATLRLLFLPPDVRFGELEELARIECPTGDDRDRVVVVGSEPATSATVPGGCGQPGVAGAAERDRTSGPAGQPGWVVGRYSCRAFGGKSPTGGGCLA